MTAAAESSRASLRAERGAAMIEFVGVIFVAAVLMGGIATRVAQGSDVPQSFWWGVCRAYQSAPGFENLPCSEPPPVSTPAPTEPEPEEPARDDRTEELGVPCVATQTNRSDAFNVVAWGVRVGEGGTDEIKINADGTATVSLSHINEAGVEVGIGKKTPNANGSSGGANATGNAYAVINNELKYTYDFPDAASALAFLEARRNAANRVVDAVLPGAQTVNELSTRLTNWLQSNVGDRMPWVSDADRARHAVEQANSTADAVSIAVGEKAAATAKVGTGAVKAAFDAELSVKGEATAYLAAARGSAFTATIEGKLGAGAAVSLSQQKATDALFNAGGGWQGGLKGSYKVVFDAAGQPTQLVITGEVTNQAILDASIKAGSLNVPALKAGTGGVTQTSWTLDLTDPANRAAFDSTFTTGSVSTGDHSAGVAMPKLPVNADQVAAWMTLGERFAQDSLEARYNYLLDTGSLSPSDKDYQAKAGVFGGGLAISETTRTLVSATAIDHRNGGTEVPLETCG